MWSKKIQNLPSLASRKFANEERIYHYYLLESSQHGICTIGMSLHGWRCLVWHKKCKPPISNLVLRCWLSAVDSFISHTPFQPRRFREGESLLVCRWPVSLAQLPLGTRHWSVRSWAASGANGTPSTHQWLYSHKTGCPRWEEASLIQWCQVVLGQGRGTGSGCCDEA